MSPSAPSTSTPTPPTHPAYTLLTTSHPPNLAHQIFTQKIQHKPLLLHPTSTTKTKPDTRALRRHIRLHKARYHTQHNNNNTRPRPLSAREKRELKIYELPSPSASSNGPGGGLKYEVYEGLNAMWQGYVREILGLVGKDGKVVEDKKAVVVGVGGGAVAVLASADFHGMKVEVVRCRDVGRVGTKGIVVRETKGTVVVVCPGDVKRVVMKRGTVFRVEVEVPGSLSHEKEGEGEGEGEGVGGRRKLVFELYGDQLEVRPVERATRKFKWHPMEYP